MCQSANGQLQISHIKNVYRMIHAIIASMKVGEKWPKLNIREPNSILLR